MRWKLVGSCRLARTSRTPLQRVAVSICTLALRYSCASLHPCRECLLVRGRASAGWSRQSLWWRIRRQLSVPKSRVTNVACLFEQSVRVPQQTTNRIAAVQTLAVMHAQLHRTKRKQHANAIPKSRHLESLSNPVLQHSRNTTLFEYFSTQRIFKRPSMPLMLSFFIGILLHFSSTIIVQLYNTSFVGINTQINCIWQWIRENIEYFKISVILSRRVLLRWRVLLRGTTGTRIRYTVPGRVKTPQNTDY